MPRFDRNLFSKVLGVQLNPNTPRSVRPWLSIIDGVAVSFAFISGMNKQGRLRSVAAVEVGGIPDCFLLLTFFFRLASLLMFLTVLPVLVLPDMTVLLDLDEEDVWFFPLHVYAITL